ncbi:TetR family transcriptional regulator [soil metagenome]
MASRAPMDKRRGRRQGEPVSRDGVLRAAKQEFAKHGYENATLRAIADEARVDPSMVLYLFGSKAELFRESMKLVLDPSVFTAQLAASEGDLGCRIVRAYLGIWEQPETAASMVSMLQSATSNSDAHEAFREFLHSYVMSAVTDSLGGGDESRLRAMLAATSLVGTAMLRYVMRVPPLSTLSVDEVVSFVGPAVDRYLTAPADQLGADLGSLELRE